MLNVFINESGRLVLNTITHCKIKARDLFVANKQLQYIQLNL